MIKNSYVTQCSMSMCDLFPLLQIYYPVAKSVYGRNTPILKDTSSVCVYTFASPLTPTLRCRDFHYVNAVSIDVQLWYLLDEWEKDLLKEPFLELTWYSSLSRKLKGFNKIFIHNVTLTAASGSSVDLWSAPGNPKFIRYLRRPAVLIWKLCCKINSIFHW